MIGLIFNALFGANYIIGLDGVSTGLYPGGWLNHNWRQLYIQIAYIVAATVYSFVVSAILAWGINLIPGLHLRASEEAELLGMDDDQLGEFAYDYVEVRRDYLAWTPMKEKMDDGDDNVAPRDRHGILDHYNMLEGKSPRGSESGKEGQAPGARHGTAAENEKGSHDPDGLLKNKLNNLGGGGYEHTGIQGDRHAQGV